MNAKKCDICGTFYPCPICNDAVRIHLDLGHLRDRYVDLCNDCYNKLCELVKPTLPEDYPVERKVWSKPEKEEA